MIEFKDRDSQYMRLFNRRSGDIEEFELVRMFGFDSDRKAMSVIVKSA